MAGSVMTIVVTPAAIQGTVASGTPAKSNATATIDTPSMTLSGPANVLSQEIARVIRENLY